jgi:hypothetical protein
VSETTGTEEIGQSDARDAEREDPSLAGEPETTTFGDEAEQSDSASGSPGRLDEREQRQHGVHQHGDTFAVETEEPTDTSGIPHATPNKVTALPKNDDAGDPLTPVGQ